MNMTFSVLSYNQEHTVLESLESIKHQVVKYGKNKHVQLLIVDDASTDRTYCLAQEWAKLNHSCFAQIDILPSDQHRGINQNLLRSLDYIEGDYIKCVAGDDLIADANIFDAINQNADLFIFAYYEFDQRNVLIPQVKDYLYWDYRFEELQQCSKYVFNPVKAPRLIISKKLIDTGYRESLCQYMYIEDAPGWEYWINGKENRLAYCNIPITLYRKAGQNISLRGTSNPYYKQFKIDQDKLYSNKLKNARGFWEQYIAYLHKKRKASGSLLYSLINPYRYYYRFQMWKHREKIQLLTSELEQNFREDNLTHLINIQASARDMYLKIMNH